MTDIIERLRGRIPYEEYSWDIAQEAAAEIERLRKLLYDITVAWHCGPLPDGTDDLAELIEGYDAHSVPGPWNTVGH